MPSSETVDFLKRLVCAKDELVAILSPYAYSGRFIITIDLHAIYKQLLKIIDVNPIERLVMAYDYFVGAQIAIIIDELQQKLLNNTYDFVDFLILTKPNYPAKNASRARQRKIAKQKNSFNAVTKNYQNWKFYILLLKLPILVFNSLMRADNNYLRTTARSFND